MEKTVQYLEAEPPKTGEPAQKQTMVASLRDLRPEVPKLELASHGGFDVLAAIRKRPFPALLIFLCCSAVGSRYVLRHVPREFHAEASVYVSPTYFKNLQQDREQLQISYSTLVNQQILTIRRFDILRDAIQRLQTQGIQWRQPGESEEGAVGRLAGALEIKYIPDSYEVLIGLDGPRAEQLAPILNTITETYLAKGRQEEMSDRNSRLAALLAEQSTATATLQQKLDEQAQFSQKLTTLNLDKAATADDALLTKVRQELEEAHRKRVEAETQLAILQESRDGSSLLSTLAGEAATTDANNRPLINGLVQRSVDLQKSTQGLTPDHPQRKAAEKEMAEIQKELKQLESGLTSDASVRLLAKVKADVDRSRLLESGLAQEVDQYTAKVQGVTKQIQLAQGVNDEIDRLRRQQNAVNSQIDALRMPGDSAGYLRIFSAARTPLAPNKSNSNKMLFAVLAASLLLGVGTALGLDLLDQRIFSPAEVKRAVGFPPVGMVLERTVRTNAFSEEHFRRLVNGIQRGIGAQKAKTIVLTPLRHARIPGNLISEIGRVLVVRGLKTAIVNANPYPAADERSGFTEGIQRLALNDNLLPESSDEDSRLPARIEMGSSEDGPSEPLVSRISGMLQGLEKEYDVVLIDAPPLSLSADTEFLATVSDITLLVVEAGEATRNELIRSANVLGRIGAPSVGVIMSQVRLRNAGRAVKRDFKRFSLSWAALPESSEA